MNFTPFLRTFAVSVILLIGATAAVLASAGADFPAPHFSRSASFNEKARWLRTALADRRCDVLVVGSSMALNSVDGAQLAGRGRRVVNLASFGVDPEDTVALLRIVLPLCRPAAVMMASYHGDFLKLPEAKDVAWGRLGAYLRGGSSVAAHAGDFDPWYLVKRTLAAAELHRTDDYMSLKFDPTGSVGLDCTARYRSEARWNADQIEQILPPRESALAAVGEVARLARAAGARFVVAVPPLRPRAEQAFHRVERDVLWHAVAARVAPFGGRVIRPAGNAGFTDPEFADYAHLNRCGAKRWTGMVLAEAREIVR